MIEFGKGRLAGIKLNRTHAELDLHEMLSCVRNTQPIIWHPGDH
jgi:hypothetical protein